MAAITARGYVETKREPLTTRHGLQEEGQAIQSGWRGPPPGEAVASVQHWRCRQGAADPEIYPLSLLQHWLQSLPDRIMRITDGRTRVISEVFVLLLNIPAVTAALPLTAFFTDPLGSIVTAASAARLV
jgi:hypothetical protein